MRPRCSFTPLWTRSGTTTDISSYDANVCVTYAERQPAECRQGDVAQRTICGDQRTAVPDLQYLVITNAGRCDCVPAYMHNTHFEQQTHERVMTPATELSQTGIAVM